MSIKDRDYMRSDFDRRGQKSKRPSLYKRILFSLWRFIHCVFKK
jgi:hypothetical protein